MTTSEIDCTELSCFNSGDRFGHTSVLFKDYIITYGGYSKTFNQLCLNIPVFNLKRHSFEDFKLEGDEPLARNRHSACLIGQDQILIFGGVGNNGILNETAMITIKDALPLTLTYEKIKTKGGENFVRYNHSADIYQNKMYVFGGRHLGNSILVCNNELWSLDLETFEWKLCKTTGDKPEPRAMHSSVVHNHKLYIFGGYSDEKCVRLNSCSVLSFETMQWENLEIKGKIFEPRDRASSVVINDTLYIIGGCSGSDNTPNGVLTFNFEEKRLDSLKCKGGYTPVTDGTAVFFKNKIILWGGLKSEGESISNLYCLIPDPSSNRSLCEGVDHSFSRYTDLLLESDQFADIQFSIEGQQIPAHKLILCLRCKYFSQLFTSGMKESNSAVIEITDVKLETFKAFLRFMYQNQVELTETLALDLYVVADKYMQTELAKLCEDFLTNNVRMGNLISLIDFAEKFGAGSLKASILGFMKRNLQEIKQNPNEYPVPFSYVWEVASQLQEKLQKYEEEKKSELTRRFM